MMTKRPLAWLALASALLASAPAFARDPKVDEILSRFADEPTVREVQKAAIAYYNVSPEKIASLRKRTREKALVPGIAVGATSFRQSNALSVDDILWRQTPGYTAARFEDGNSAYYGGTVALTWSLERLVFNAEELDVMSLIGIQDGIQREVTTLYYVRRRLQIELMLSPPNTLEARISSELRLEELTGLLDAYTGGFFSGYVAKRQKAEEARIERGPAMPELEIRAVAQSPLGMRIQPPPAKPAAAPSDDVMK